jgi:hypothetical protein
MILSVFPTKLLEAAPGLVAGHKHLSSRRHISVLGYGGGPVVNQHQNVK